MKSHLRNILFLLVFFQFFGMKVNGQQAGMFSQYMLDKYQFNPAYGGLERSLHLNAVVRSQWTGIPGRPLSQYLNGHLPFYIWNGSIGFALANESIGALRNVNLSFSYNYVAPLEFGLFSIGGSLGVVQKSVDGSSIITPEGDYADRSFFHNDPLLQEETYTGLSPNWSFGAYFKADQFDIGVSIVNLAAPALTAELNTFEFDQVAMLYGEYRMFMNEDYEFIPSFLVRTNFAQAQTDVNATVKYQERIFGGIGLRGYNSNSFDALIMMAGTKISSKMSLVYSFDAGLSAIKRVNEGTHEIRIIYNLNRPIATGLPPPIIYNPRFL